MLRNAVIVEVFKTNVLEIAHAQQLTDIIGTQFPGSRITFDLDDCDKVLRIAGSAVCADEVTRMVNAFGFSCDALE